MRLGMRFGVAAVVVAATSALGLTAVSAAATPRSGGSTLMSGHTLSPGLALWSPDHHYELAVSSRGQLRLATASGHGVWATPAVGAGAVLLMDRSGDLRLTRGGHTVWDSGTRGAAGAHLQVTDGAVLVSATAGTVWSSVQGNRCGNANSTHEVIVHIWQQRAWVCAGHEQQLVTPVTTGATDLGDGTPTGTWSVYAKVRDTTLYPASGGAYPVNYWMPYNGAYGMHDAPWQTFPYGSSLYLTQGSHGCVHFPEAAMGWLFDWAPVGTTVTVSN